MFYSISLLLYGGIYVYLYPVQCSEDQFQCGHGLFCVDRSVLCDYVNDCHDRSDELNCGYGTSDTHFTALSHTLLE